MKKTLFKCCGVFLFGVMLAAQFVSSAEAKVRLTVHNQSAKNVSLAFCWSGFDYDQNERRGWFTVNAGESKLIVLPPVYALTANGFGFYAKGAEGTWEGDIEEGGVEEGNELKVVIHPTASFRGHPEAPIEGGETVTFRPIKLTGSEDNMDGSATITLKP